MPSAFGLRAKNLSLNSRAGWNRGKMDFYLIGFFPKRRVTRFDWDSSQDGKPQDPFPEPQPIQQLCSVSNCMVKGLLIFDYQELSIKSFNQYGGFNQTGNGILHRQTRARPEHDCGDLEVLGLMNIKCPIMVLDIGTNRNGRCRKMWGER